MGKSFEALLRNASMKHARKLVTLVKYWLRCRFLHEPFNGGLGSYSVLVLVVSHLQHNQRRNGESLASLFRSFFRFYGFEFNWITLGISVLDGGRYFSKLDRGGSFASHEPWKPALEDPCDRDNNISQASFQLPKIREAMRSTSEALTALGDIYDLEEDFSGVLPRLMLPPYPKRL